MNGGVTVHDLLGEALVMSGLSDLFVVSSKTWLLLFLDRRTKICLGMEPNRRTPDSDLVAYVGFSLHGYIRISGRTRLDALRLQRQKTEMHHGCLLSILVFSVI
jgi:hypothetical protein